jgi:SynChlorMet cassette radical SAM/SPASM protein ScmF
LNNPFVSVSIDGADALTHDRVRGVAGAFEKATSAVKHLADNGVNPQVIMSIMQSNADQLEAVIELAEKLGADSVKFNIIQPTGRGKTIRDSASGMEVKDLILLGRKVETELAAKTELKLFFDYPVAFRSLKTFASGDGCGVCSILSILGVLPTGEYALCGIGSHIPELVFGKAGQDKLAYAWQKDETLRQLRSGLPVNLTGICSTCLMKYYCFGSCIAQNYYRTNSLWAPFWFCEQAHSFGLFPESRLDFSSKNPS